MRHAATCVLTLLALLPALWACRHEPRGVDDPKASVYYWRTTLRLDSAERDFLARHGIGRAYVRYFDVVDREGQPMPNATLRFADTLPAGIEVVPTVFVMENVLRLDTTGLAARLVQRVLQMCETNDIAPVREMQVDCDWTVRSQDAYYALLARMRRLLAARGMRLSATIRLHQLTLPPPPVDYGVLMVYNTGDFRRRNGRNPVLDPRDVDPYLNYVHDYDLPLCAAYPDFSWRLLFSGKDFKALLYDINLDDSELLRRIDSTRYVVVMNRDLPVYNSDASGNVWLVPGDSVLVERPAASTVLLVRDRLERRRPGLHSQTVIYHLDSRQFKQYNNDYYETLFNP